MSPRRGPGPPSASPTRLFVVGATGVLGRRVVARALAHGHRVTGAARDARAADTLRALGATPLAVDLFDSSEVRQAVAGHDVVVNLATAVPSISKATLPGAFRANDNLRARASRILVDATLAGDVGRYIRESVTMAYPDRADDWIVEDTPLDPEAHLRTVAEAENDTRRLTAAGRDAVVLRFAYFCGPDAEHTQEQLRLARRLRIGGAIGPTDAYFSIIHLDDAADATISALDAPPGTYNVTDDEPLTRREHLAAQAWALGVTRLRRPPTWLTDLAGPPARAMMRSQRVSNRALRTSTPWRPTHPSAWSAWQDSVAST